ncbi:F-box/kelch-repeat protein [Senna tora]|uniref:F-box/kelch-repeat protein n=1 Tax=Senna tora TaxID=362788 RepID=A0A834WFP1_9FABA|nr:F-box/kelch-repeat protein [Senna tora]
MARTPPRCDIPHELILSIFEYLPPKSLLRFSTLSKDFYSLIHNPSFVAATLKRSNYDVSSPDKHPNLLYHSSRFNRYNIVKFYSNEEIESLCALHEHLIGNDKNRYRLELIGSCNGLLCFLDREQNGFYCWNPLLKKGIKQEFMHGDNDTPDTFGFGYDSSTNHFKLCCTTKEILDGEIIVSAVLYTLSTGIGEKSVWRVSSIPPPPTPHFLRPIPRNCYASGATHWLVFDPSGAFSCSSIVSFHMKDEVFREFDLPRGFELPLRGEPYYYFGIVLSEIDGMLAISPHVLGFKKPFIVWVMKVYGDAESWFPFVSMSLSHPMGKFLRLRHGKVLDVLGIKNNGQDIWVYSYDLKQVCVFNLKTLKLRKGKSIPSGKCWFCEAFSETLALMDVEDEWQIRDGNNISTNHHAWWPMLRNQNMFTTVSSLIQHNFTSSDLVSLINHLYDSNVANAAISSIPISVTGLKDSFAKAVWFGTHLGYHYHPDHGPTITVNTNSHRYRHKRIFLRVMEHNSILFTANDQLLCSFLKVLRRGIQIAINCTTQRQHLNIYSPLPKVFGASGGDFLQAE